jgi:hypothetical protein
MKRKLYIIKLLGSSKEATRQNLQTRPKILKNLLEHHINQSERKSFQKRVFSTLVEPKLRMGDPRRNLPRKLQK